MDVVPNVDHRCIFSEVCSASVVVGRRADFAIVLVLKPTFLLAPTSFLSDRHQARSRSAKLANAGSLGPCEQDSLRRASLLMRAPSLRPLKSDCETLWGASLLKDCRVEVNAWR